MQEAEKMLNGKTILITGGTGSFGNAGTKRSESLLTEFSVLEKKITSGSMVQVPVVHVQRSIMTVERSMVAENLAVQ